MSSTLKERGHVSNATTTKLQVYSSLVYRTSTVFTHSIAARVPCSVLSMVVVVVVPFWYSFGASYSVFPRLLIVLRVAVPDPTRSILDPHDAVDPSYPDRYHVALISLAAVAVVAASADHW